MSENRFPPNQRQKKNVRFPEDSSLSQSRDASSSEAEDEPDYFSYPSRARQDSIATEDEEEDGDDATEFRQQTRTNTLQNRLSVPGFSVTPPPETALGSSGMGLQGLGDLGNSGGLAPGAQSHEDNDPLNDEYTHRRKVLLDSLTPEQLRMVQQTSHSVPDSPATPHTPNEGSGNNSGGAMEGAIPLKTLVSGVEQRLEQLQQEQQNPAGSSESQKPQENSSDRTLKDDDPEKDLKSVTSPDTTRLQAEEIARQLVKAHGLNGGASTPTSNDGFIQNPGYLEKAVGFDNEAEVNPEDAETRENNAGMEMEVGGKLADEELPPERVREGILGSILRLYAEREADAKSTMSMSTSGMTPLTTPGGSPLQSPSVTPPPLSRTGSSRDSLPTMGNQAKRKSGGLRPPTFMRTHSSEDILGRNLKGRRQWHDKEKKHKTGAASAGLASLAASTFGGSSPVPDDSSEMRKEKKKKGFLPVNPTEHYAKQAAKRKRRAKLEAEQARITIHIADVLQRQRFILRFGRALMLFGAPSHRLEEYLRVTARTLEIDAQFLYMPGCMLVSFGDATTHTSETKLLRVTQGLNLTKLDQTHLIFKEVVHGIMEIEEAGTHIDNLLQSKNLYPAWASILFFGLGTGFLCIFAFGGWWTDLPIAALMGGLVGFLQIWVAPRSDLYANVFEVSASVLISFLGRAFGSIHPSKPIFCFGAIVQGSLALILPGYIILCGSLELQSKNLVAGAVRMFYAIIYSTFLSFGITLGSAIFGWIDGSAVARTDCWAHTPIDDKFKILFVPLSATFLSLVNQASPRQLPTMVFIACCGYTVLYFVQNKIANASSFTSALGALTIGLLGNLYSRVGHGLAFAAMLPGIFVIVPSGVAAQGSLIAGLNLAETITNRTNHSGAAAPAADTSGSTVNDLGGTMTEVAVGITVGLFVATLVVYPLGTGTKRSGLFTF